MFDILKQLCIKNNITITKLCVDITGNKGNLTTWKKDSFNSRDIIKIANYFKISADYLLGLNIEQKTANEGQAELHFTQKAILEHANNIGISETLELLQGYEKLKDKQKGRILGNINALSN